MKLPVEFYYKRDVSNVGLTNIPGGTFMPTEKLRGNKKCWLSTTESSEYQPVELLFHDYRIRGYSKEKLTKLLELFKELLNQGFAINIDHLENIYEDEVQRDYTIQELITPIIDIKINHPNVYVEAHLKLKNLLPGQVMVLDDDWVDYLLIGPAAAENKTIYISDLSDYTEVELDDLLKIIKQSPNPVKNIVDDYFDCFSNDFLERVIKVFPKADVSQKFTKIHINLINLIDLIKHGSTIVNNRKLTIDQFTNAEKIEIDGESNKRAMDDVLVNYFKNTVFPNLKILQLGPLSYLITVKVLQPRNVPELMILNVNKTVMSSSLFSYVNRLAPNLKMLALEHVSIDEVWNNLPADNFGALTKLKTKNCTKVFPLINHVLQHCSMIKNIELQNPNDTDNGVHVFSKHMGSLDSFKITVGRMNAINFYSLLISAQNSKEIYFDIDEENQSSTVSWSAEVDRNEKTTILYLFGGFFRAALLNDVLNHFVGLNKLKLHQIDLKSSSTNIAFNEDLKTIKKFTLSDSLVKSTDVEHILQSVSEVEELNLEFLTIIDTIRVRFEKYRFRNLINLMLIDIPGFCASDLQSILIGSNDLRSLTLCELNISDQIVHLNPNSLPYLTNIKLVKVFINVESLVNLLLSTSQLKTLTLIDCTVIDKGQLPEGVFSALEEFTITSPEFGSFKSLIAILSLMPKLKVANLMKIKLNEKEKKELSELLPNVTITIEDVPFKKPKPQNTGGFNSSVIPNNDVEFTYEGKGKYGTSSQFINQLSQYLSLTNQHLNQIPVINVGVCCCLSHLFLDMEQSEWQELVSDLNNWNGSISTLSQNLTTKFELILIYYFKYQVTQPAFNYLGDKFASLLNQWKHKFVISNFQHAIAIKPINNGEKWCVFDSNSGVCEVSHSDLEKQITQILGPLILLGGDVPVDITINDQIKFIEEGGLRALSCANKLDVVAKLKFEKPLSVEALKGLLVIGNTAFPIWVNLLWSSTFEIKNIGINLLKQFLLLVEDSVNQLLDSIQYMKERYKIKIINLLLELQKYENKALNFNFKLDQLIKGICNTPEYMNYESKLEVWRSQYSKAATVLEYVQEVCAPGKNNKILLNLDTNTHVQGMIIAIELYCLSTNRPYYYIDKPDDLICSAPYIVRENNRGKRANGPGGPLVTFLKGCTDNQDPVLVLNYGNFYHADIVRTYDLFSKERKADGTQVPENVTIIGIRPLKFANVYNKSDFNSRFDKKSKTNIPKNLFEQYLSSIPIVNQSNVVSEPINLFNSSNWESILLGSSTIDEQGLRFVAGKLKTALTRSAAIEIQNGPWANIKFQNFWIMACSRGYYDYDGERVSIPNNLTIVKSEGYNWTKYKSHFNVVEQVTNPEILNPSCLYDFIKVFKYIEESKSIVEAPGIIRAIGNANEIRAKKRRCSPTLVDVPIYLTKSISIDLWAMLLEECTEYNIVLQVQCAPGVELPKELYTGVLNTSLLAQLTCEVDNTKVVVCNDAETFVHKYTSINKSDVIDVTDLTCSDLIERLDPVNEEHGTGFEFIKNTCVLASGLNNKKSMVLKGVMSPSLADQLAPFIIKRMSVNAKDQGHLLIVVQDSSTLQFLPYYRETTNENDKLHCLFPMSFDVTNQILKYINTDSLSHLKARKNYLMHQGAHLNSDVLWNNLYNLNDFQFKIGQFNIDTAQVEAEQHIQFLFNQINIALSYSFFVYLTGFSGSGKTTFILNEYSKCAHVHVGKENKLAWALDKRTGTKVLYLPEVNLGNDNLLDLEGLHNENPFIVIDGIPYQLSKDHKVIMDSNPLSYGDERKIPLFLLRHANTVVFPPLPCSVIFYYVLKPVFHNTNLINHLNEICHYYFNVYAYLIALSTTDVLITPRELQMMAIMTVTYAIANPNVDANYFAALTAYKIGKTLVPSHKTQDFEQIFKVDINRQDVFLSANTNHCITHSRFELRTLLNDLIYLRALRRSGFGSKEFQFGGLGGIIIEGESGIGKSEFINDCLHYYDFKVNNDYLVVGSSMPIAQQEAVLLEAADLGALAINDESNAAPLSEKLKNDLLMGIIPGKGQPSYPGFIWVGMQNSAEETGGRRLMSKALSSRVLTYKLPAYDDFEMQQILINKGIPERFTVTLISAYKNKVAQAKAEHLSPEPCFRDLCELADYLKAGMNRLMNVRDDFIKNNTIKTVSRRKQHMKPMRAIKKDNVGFFKENTMPANEVAMFVKKNQALNM